MGIIEDKTFRGVTSGALTGALEITISYPVKYVKTQLQLERSFGKERLYSGMIDCARKTVQNHGFLGLYRGLNVFLYAPKSSIRFGLFEFLKGQFADENGNLDGGWKRFLCGLGAGAVEAAVINTPLETIETKLINDQRTGKLKYKGFIDGTKAIIREKGLKGIYQGLYPSVLKQASNQGIRFFVMETLKDKYRNGDHTKPIPKTIIALFGGVAGFTSCMGNNPLDVVKTRMQGLEANRYRNFIDCFVQIWKYEGFFSFYRGVTPRLGRVMVEVAITFVIYEYFQDAFKRFSEKS